MNLRKLKIYNNFILKKLNHNLKGLQNIKNKLFGKKNLLKAQKLR